jgi:hypothetical protein
MPAPPPSVIPERFTRNSRGYNVHGQFIAQERGWRSTQKSKEADHE